MSDDAQEWRWVGEDGVEKTVTEQELIAELSSESLPNYTLVWKKKWLEWLPAMQVAELIWALPPGKADSPVHPREKETAATPPAPPLYRYPVVKRRAANLKTGKGTPPPVPVVSVAPAKPVAAEPEPVAKVARRISFEPPTQEWKPDSHPIEEVEIDSIEASEPAAALFGLAPAGASLLEDEGELSDPLHPAEFAKVSSVHAAFSRMSYGEEDDAETRVIPSRPPPPGAMYVAPRVPPASERPGFEYDDADLEEMPRIPPPPTPPSDLVALATGAGKVDRRRLVIIGSGSAIVATLLLVAIVRRHRASPAPSEAAVASSAPPEAATGSSGPAAASVAHAGRQPATTERLGKPCTITTSATRIADWADPAIAPVFEPIPGSGRVAVGFAQSDTYALGITIDPRSLDHDQVFREYRQQHVVSVVPTTGDGALHFQVVRDGFPLASARAIDARTPFFVGATPDAISRVTGKQSPVPLWSLGHADELTVPRVATVPGVGHVLVFRHGGKSGVAAAAWLLPSGRKKTKLVDIKSDGDLVGTPNVAASDAGIAIAFAVRKAAGRTWTLSLASAKHGELPTSSTTFALPPGGPGGSGISPAVTPLSGARFLLTWTEGASGNRSVRAVVLDRNLSAVSDAVTLSPDGANAGQGVAWSHGDVVSVLYYVQNDKRTDELWGTSLDCPR